MIVGNIRLGVLARPFLRKFTSPVVGTLQYESELKDHPTSTVTIYPLMIQRNQQNVNPLLITMLTLFDAGRSAAVAVVDVVGVTTGSVPVASVSPSLS